MGKHSGPGKAGYSRGRREKPGTDTFGGRSQSGGGDYSELRLAHMHPAHMMGQFESRRQGAANYHAAKAASGLSEALPSRSEEFHDLANMYAHMSAGNRANAVSYGRQTTPIEKLTGRKEHFERGRYIAGQAGGGFN